jgi:ankyrin repeat protein
LGSIEVVELLIGKGANINSASCQQKHSTPVMIAAAAGHADVVQVLIDHGADLTVRNDDSSTVLGTAIAGRHADTIGLLLEVLGGDDYPQESIAIDVVMATSVTAVKSVMTDMGLFQSDMESTTLPSTYRAIVDQILRDGGELMKPYALSNMMSAALHEKDIAVTIALLAYGYDPNQYLAQGQTPLHIAIVQQNTRLVELLLEYGADPVLPTCDVDGLIYTPLHQAFITLDLDHYRDTSIVDLLLETHQCKLMTGSDARSTAFDYVLSHYSRWDHGVADIMTFRMLQLASGLHGDRSEDGSTLMHAAVWHGRADLISTLIAKGLDINAMDNQGCTPFLLQCHRSTRLLRFLLSNGADPHAKDNDDQTALHAAASQGQIGVITFLFHVGLPINTTDKSDYTPFTWAVICGQEDAALHLLNLGAKFSSKLLRSRRTLLHVAASLNMSRLVAKFLDTPLLKNCVNEKDKLGFTALELACRQADRTVVEALIDAGADLHGRPLYLALNAENASVAGCLIERGADVKARGENDHTPLHIALDLGVVQMLLERGADVNALDQRDLTPISYCRDADIAQLLIAHGADVHHTHSHGWLGLHRAVQDGNVDMFRVLLRAGADVSSRLPDDGLDVCERIEDIEDEEVRVAFEQMLAHVEVGPGLL